MKQIIDLFEESTNELVLYSGTNEVIYLDRDKSRIVSKYPLEKRAYPYIIDVSYENIFFKFIEGIRENCQQFLVESDGFPMHRGSHKLRSPFHDIRSTPEYRLPVDSPLGFQTIADKYFKNNNFEARRHNSIFVSGHSESIDFYGKHYIIFPKDGYSYTWSPHVNDFHAYLYRDRSKSESVIYEKIAQAEYKKTELKEALLSGNEIMVRSDNGYYAMHYDRINFFRKLTYNDLIKIIKNF